MLRHLFWSLLAMSEISNLLTFPKCLIKMNNKQGKHKKTMNLFAHHHQYRICNTASAHFTQYSPLLQQKIYEIMYSAICFFTIIITNYLSHLSYNSSFFPFFFFFPC